MSEFEVATKEEALPRLQAVAKMVHIDHMHLDSDTWTNCLAGLTVKHAIANEGWTPTDMSNFVCDPEGNKMHIGAAGEILLGVEASSFFYCSDATINEYLKQFLPTE